MFVKIKRSIMDEFDIIDLERMRYFLGIEITQKSNGIFVGKNKYVYKVSKKFKMSEQPSCS